MPAVRPCMRGMHTSAEKQRVGRGAVVKRLINKVEKEGDERGIR